MYFYQFKHLGAGLPSQTNNAITIDVEDWYHICGLKNEPNVPAALWRVRRNIEFILALLEEFGIKATFFILGCIAQSDPELAPLIASGGHEIASHGYSHCPVTQLSPEGFRDEIQRTATLLHQQTGQQPVGFRAPQWSLSLAKTPWAFEILVQEGYLYDSSLNPLPLVGDSRGSRFPFHLSADGATIQEFPPLVAPSLIGNLPVGGGWGFRLFPLELVVKTVEAYNQRKQPAVLYLHPREVDPGGPRIPLSPLKSFAAYGPRRDSVSRLRSLFGKFSFTGLGALAKACH